MLNNGLLLEKLKLICRQFTIIYNHLWLLRQLNVVFGNGEVLSQVFIVLQELHQRWGTLYFDGAGDPDALLSFGFQLLQQQQLRNGFAERRKSNIFWVIEGAASIEASSTLKGTIMTHGAIQWVQKGTWKGDFSQL
jgi:hypothetical protein